MINLPIMNYVFMFFTKQNNILYFYLFFIFLLTISLTRKVLPIVHDDVYDNGNVQQIHIRTDVLR